MNKLRLATGQLQAVLTAQQARDLNLQRTLNYLSFGIFVTGAIVMLLLMLWIYNELLSYVSERDAAHARLQEANVELEARVEERTRDLTRANEELQQFAYVASHDLQEPLRTITSFTQLIAERYKGQLDEDADEFIGYIVASSRRMTDLINGLLALARLRKSGQPTTPADFEQIVEEAKLNLQASIRENAARVEYGKLPSLIVDKLQFAQVFQNLISNAIKYRREEPPVIRIEARRESTNWIFSVSDNGQGFRQEFAERIFGMFQRLSPQGVVGTGIGLSIARKIVERHGGRIWANSREGEGSTFYFSLPVSLKATRESETEVHAVVEKS